jgi:hypothetical protein
MYLGLEIFFLISMNGPYFIEGTDYKELPCYKPFWIDICSKIFLEFFDSYYVG